MQIRYHCPADGCVAIIQYEPLEGSGPTMKCPRCKVDHPMSISDAVHSGEMVDRCVVCGGRELFIKKDFPQGLGLAVVVLFGALAIYMFTVNVMLAWAVLTAAALIDLSVYVVVGRVTTCYACRAEYRKCHLNPAHEGFDLATSEKY